MPKITHEHRKYGYESAVVFISDREEPMDAAALAAWHEEITGRAPTVDELAEMRPDTADTIHEQATYHKRGRVW